MLLLFQPAWQKGQGKSNSAKEDAPLFTSNALYSPSGKSQVRVISVSEM